jgi:hypothetical protein
LRNLTLESQRQTSRQLRRSKLKPTATKESLRRSANTTCNFSQSTTTQSRSKRHSWWLFKRKKPWRSKWSQVLILRSSRRLRSTSSSQYCFSSTQGFKLRQKWSLS